MGGMLQNSFVIFAAAYAVAQYLSTGWKRRITALDNDLERIRRTIFDEIGRQMIFPSVVGRHSMEFLTKLENIKEHLQEQMDWNINGVWPLFFTFVIAILYGAVTFFSMIADTACVPLRDLMNLRELADMTGIAPASLTENACRQIKVWNTAAEVVPVLEIIGQAALIVMFVGGPLGLIIKIGEVNEKIVIGEMMVKIFDQKIIPEMKELIPRQVFIVEMTEEQQKMMEKEEKMVADYIEDQMNELLDPYRSGKTTRLFNKVISTVGEWQQKWLV